jgi:hypothetical protein
MDRRDDARAQELSNLRLALATFAVQLDVFEMRMAEGRFRAGIKSGIRVRSLISVTGFRRREMIARQ